MRRRDVLAALTAAGAAALPFSVPAAAQEFPVKPVRIIVPVAPGGGTDVLARALAERLREIWNQPVLVENKPGAGHVVGTTLLAQSAPDGHTLGMIGMPHVVNPSLQPDLPYKAIADFTPIAMMAHIPVVAVVHPSLPVANLAELAKLAREKPGQINFAATSTNGAGHLAGELLRMRANIDLTFVPYRGSAPALQDVLAGRVPLMFDALLTVEQHIKAGTLRPIAVTTAARVPALPAVPTAIEAGYPDFLISAWLGLLAPGKLPDGLADRIADAVIRSLDTPAVRERLEKQGWTVLPMGRDRGAFAAYLAREVPVWAEVVKAAKLKAQ